MSSGDVWILGIRMTKFGKHADKDIVDLGAEFIGPTQNRIRALAAKFFGQKNREKKMNPSPGLKLR